MDRENLADGRRHRQAGIEGGVGVLEDKLDLAGNLEMAACVDRLTEQLDCALGGPFQPDKKAGEG